MSEPAAATRDIVTSTATAGRPLVSAIMPVYNGERFIAAALASALGQTYAPLEIIVLDDGSTDGSAAIVDAFAAAHPGRIRYVAQANQGLCAARNAAIAQATGRYLALLDCDDLWCPTHIERAVAALEADAEVVLVHADVRFVDPDDRVLQDFTGDDGWETARQDPFTALLLRYRHIACPTAVFRADVARRIGGFDLAYSHLGCEDRDMWLRLSLHGTVRHLAYHAADYRVHDGGMSRNGERMLQARRLLVEKMRAFPQGERLHRRARAAVSLSEAEQAVGRPERGRRMRAYLRAIRLSPGDARGWRGLARELAS